MFGPEDNYETHCASDLDRDPVDLPKAIFPLIRKVYPNLIAQDLVGVQPMTSPGGSIFYLQHHHVQVGDYVEIKESDFEHNVAKESEMKNAEVANMITEMANKIHKRTLLENKKPADWAIVHPSILGGPLA